METPTDLTSMAIVALAALVCGMVMVRLRQPTIVGYIAAGMLLGPSMLGLVADREQINSLAELGVLMLLFLVGMELSVRAFMVSWRIALSAVALQVCGSMLVIMACSSLLGFSLKLSILLGFVIALSSTAVAIKMMEEIGELRTRVGRITVGILIAQDLAFLPMLLIAESLGSGEFGIGGVLRIAVSVALLVILMLVLNRREHLHLPFARIFVGNIDLSLLTGLGYCFGASAVFGLMGLSAPYGAFLAGLIIGCSVQRERMIQAVRPVQAILVMVFFLSIGLLIDLRYVFDNIVTVMSLLLVVTLFKAALNVGIMRLLGETWRRAFMEGLLISQLGEFSFVLAASGLAAGAIGAEESRLIIAVTVLSLMLSPFWLTAARRIHNAAADGGFSARDFVGIATRGDADAMHNGSGWLALRLFPAIRALRGVPPAPLALPPPADPVPAGATSESAKAAKATGDAGAATRPGDDSEEPVLQSSSGSARDER